MNSLSTISVPHLQTERLMLREYRREDFGAFANHFANPVSSVHFARVDGHTAWRVFCSHAGLWLLDGAGWWAVEERQTGQLVGNVGAFFREDSTVMELGWNTYSAFWGKGYAKEAAAAALSYAFEIRREPKVRALIVSGNEPSIRVAQRLGLVYEADIEMFGKPIGCYTCEREGSIV